MITRQDILDRAAEWQMQPHVVEKDYVLGWLLAATTVHPIAKEYWVFKGGTSIKKCYFETYRFSEDLDFSLLPDAPYSEEEIKNTINELTQKATEMSGIVFAQDSTIVSARHDKLNRPTFQGKIYYQGPLGQVRSFPKIIFDITNNEPILGIPARRPILHAYPDALAAESGVLTYALDELLAENDLLPGIRCTPPGVSPERHEYSTTVVYVASTTAGSGAVPVCLGIEYIS